MEILPKRSSVRVDPLRVFDPVRVLENAHFLGKQFAFGNFGNELLRSWNLTPPLPLLAAARRWAFLLGARASRLLIFPNLG
jgi:hypothetical protein